MTQFERLMEVGIGFWLLVGNGKRISSSLIDEFTLTTQLVLFLLTVSILPPLSGPRFPCFPHTTPNFVAALGKTRY